MTLNPIKKKKTRTTEHQLAVGLLMNHPLIRHLGMNDYKDLFRGVICSMLPILDVRFKEWHNVKPRIALGNIAVVEDIQSCIGGKLTAKQDNVEIRNTITPTRSNNVLLPKGSK